MAEVCQRTRHAQDINIILHTTGQPLQTTDLIPSRRTYLEPDFTGGIIINEKARSSSQKF